MKRLVYIEWSLSFSLLSSSHTWPVLRVRYNLGLVRILDGVRRFPPVGTAYCWFHRTLSSDWTVSYDHRLAVTLLDHPTLRTSINRAISWISLIHCSASLFWRWRGLTPAKMISCLTILNWSTILRSKYPLSACSIRRPFHFAKRYFVFMVSSAASGCLQSTCTADIRIPTVLVYVHCHILVQICCQESTRCWRYHLINWYNLRRFRWPFVNHFLLSC